MISFFLVSEFNTLRSASIEAHGVPMASGMNLCHPHPPPIGTGAMWSSAPSINAAAPVGLGGQVVVGTVAGGSPALSQRHLHHQQQQQQQHPQQLNHQHHQYAAMGVVSDAYQMLPFGVGYEPEPPSYAVAVSRATAMSVQSQGSGDFYASFII